MGNPIFISYKRVDKKRVFEIKDYIESKTGLSCWIDLDGIESDAIFKNVIIKAINACDIMLFMYSKAHLDIEEEHYNKDWTVKELNFASKKKKRIVFVNIDGSELTDLFEFDYGEKQQIDANDPTRLKKLAHDIKRWVKTTDIDPVIDPDNITPGNPKDKILVKRNTSDKIDRKGQQANDDVEEAECFYKKGYNLYYGVEGVERNVKKAFHYFQESSKLNHRKAQEFLAKYYLLGIVVEKDKDQGEYWMTQSKLPDEQLNQDMTALSTKELPKSLMFEYSGKKFYMLLSENEKFYLGNLNAEEGDWSWWDNKWIKTMGTGAICASAIAFGIISIPIGILLALKALESIFSDKETSGVFVDSKLCNQLSETTGYRFSVPDNNELIGVKKEEKAGCIVLKVCDNTKLFPATK